MRVCSRSRRISPRFCIRIVFCKILYGCQGNRMRTCRAPNTSSPSFYHGHVRTYIHTNTLLLCRARARALSFSLSHTHTSERRDLEAQVVVHCSVPPSACRGGGGSRGSCHTSSASSASPTGCGCGSREGSGREGRSVGCGDGWRNAGGSGNPCHKPCALEWRAQGHLDYCPGMEGALPTVSHEEWLALSCVKALRINCVIVLTQDTCASSVSRHCASTVALSCLYMGSRHAPIRLPSHLHIHTECCRTNSHTELGQNAA